jgi:hypothetical protein
MKHCTPVALVCAFALVLAGCGNGNAPIADACKAEIMRKGEGVNITVDDAKMLSSIAKQADGTYLLQGEAILNPGQPSEKNLPYRCVVQDGAEGQSPSVIRAEFDYMDGA